ncbi:MAG TPA: ABC transporter permease [Vicinamibacterales bacterium]|nr:ABC transporter permease [Vicinamibacterales bacterium]
MKRSLRSWLWRVPIDQEIDEELALHVEMRTRELVARGMDPNAARELAIRRLGDVAHLRREMSKLGRKRDRDMRVTNWLDELRGDLRFAFRQLRRSPAFTLVATLTLALGIGVNSAIFALVDATLLRPLPYAEPDRLVAIWENGATIEQSYVSPLNMLDWIARSRTFEKIAGFTPSVGGMVMAGADGNAETVSRQWVSAGIFDVLGVKPIAGRTFSEDDDVKRANVVVMSESFWRTRFNADPSVVGRDLRLDGSRWTVVGIVPGGFQLIGQSSIWAMRPIINLPPRARGAYVLQVVGRTTRGVSIAAAKSDLAAIADNLAREFPETNKGRGVTVETLHDSVIGRDLRFTSMLFLGVVGFVLLICCANVANLLLARATVRRRELAVRSALGAGRRRIVRQLVTESLVLSLVGGALGSVLGAAILSAAPRLIPQGVLPASVALTFDARVVAFCAVAAVLVGLVFGVMPAWRATNFFLTEVIGSDGRTVTSSAGRVRGLLVVGEVAIAVLLLFGAGLLLRTLMAVDAFDRGYGADSVLSMLVDPLGSKYPTDESLQQFFDEVEAEISAVPGVAAVAWASALPLDFFESDGFSFEIAGDPPRQDGQRPTTEYQVVSPAYFSTLDLPILAGRSFDRRDTRDGLPVCIVNEAFARSLGGRSPIGLRVALRPVAAPQAKPVVHEIVGVARQVKGRPDEVKDFVQVYIPMAQGLSDDMFLVVRPKSGRAEALTPSVRAAISRIDREQLVSVRSVMTLEDIAWAATGRHRFRAVMVIAFAVLALVLAMVGLFGILAYSVQQQVREFGVRRALGATTNDVLRLVLAHAARVIAAGGAIGLVLSAVCGRFIQTMLFGVRPLDPATFALVTIVLGIAAALSIVGPAWRVARIDPAAALRDR